jgi:protoheme IX farnesyltransferase
VFATDAMAVLPRANSRDWLALAKPRLSCMVLLTCGVGLWLAPGAMSALRALATLWATAAVVAAANGLNSYLERHSDGRMRRTRLRPLPAGRLAAGPALWTSLVAGLVAVGTLYWAANPLTALLAFAAFASYAWVYTPMKRYSWWAVVVGAFPGAIPPLMGWTAVTDHLGLAGFSLFGLMFFWQLPHFFAIALYLREDYARGGLQVLPLVHGRRATVWAIIVTAAALIPATVLPMWAGVAGPAYGWVALGSGLVFFAATCVGLRNYQTTRWARQIFLASVAHLTLLLATLLIGAHTWVHNKP